MDRLALGFWHTGERDGSHAGQDLLAPGEGGRRERDVERLEHGRDQDGHVKHALPECAGTRHRQGKSRGGEDAPRRGFVFLGRLLLADDVWEPLGRSLTALRRFGMTCGDN